MFEIGPVFHVSHTVEDLDAALAWYREVFAAHVWQHTTQAGVPLALLLVGDVSLMPMAPPPDSPAAPARFAERYGSRLHSLALYVHDPVALIGHLRAQGLRLIGSDGTDLKNPQDEIWTHPRQTPCQFELFEPREYMNDPRFNEPDWSSAFWRDEHPMGILGGHYTIVAGDRGAAAEQLVELFNGRVLHDSPHTAHDTASTFVGLGERVLIELAEPLDPAGRAAQDLAVGTTFHAVTLRVRDLGRAGAHLAEHGVATTEVAPGHLTLDPAHTFNATFRLTDRELSAW